MWGGGGGGGLPVFSKATHCSTLPVPEGRRVGQLPGQVVMATEATRVKMGGEGVLMRKGDSVQIYRFFILFYFFDIPFHITGHSYS